MVKNNFVKKILIFYEIMTSVTLKTYLTGDMYHAQWTPFISFINVLNKKLQGET